MKLKLKYFVYWILWFHVNCEIFKNLFLKELQIKKNYKSHLQGEFVRKFRSVIFSSENWKHSLIKHVSSNFAFLRIMAEVPQPRIFACKSVTFATFEPKFCSKWQRKRLKFMGNATEEVNCVHLYDFRLLNLISLSANAFIYESHKTLWKLCRKKLLWNRTVLLFFNETHILCLYPKTYW